MKKQDKQQSNRNYKVYIPRLKQWVEVTKEQYYGNTAQKIKCSKCWDMIK